jgi:Na+-driven multidrug efflux pump
VAVAGFFLTPVFLTATGCPAECYEGAMLYMRITLAAAPATLLYNYGSAILRSFGDTQRPLIYVTVAGVVNVGLNMILCLILPQKVMAVAIATVASKVVSTALVMVRLCRTEDAAKVTLSDLRFDFSAFMRIFRFGIPASISSLVHPMGNLQITSAINSFGAEAIAGHSAAVSVENFVHAFVTGFGSSAMTFIGQNIGAKKVDRVKKSLWLCMGYSTAIAGSLGVLTYLTGEFWIGIIVGRTAETAISYGMLRFFYVIQFVFLYAISSVLTGALKAFGYPMLTSLTNIFFNLGFRVFWMSVVYPKSSQFNTIMFCFTVSWTLNLIFYAIFAMAVYVRYVKTGKCRKI